MGLVFGSFLGSTLLLLFSPRRNQLRVIPEPALLPPGMPQGKRILIVHDTEDVADYMADILQAGFKVAVAYNGISGLQRALRFRPDVIIANTTMPGLGGLELCNKLKRDSSLQNCRVVICSGLHPPPDKQAILDRGADEFLPEPFSREQLLAALQNVLAS